MAGDDEAAAKDALYAWGKWARRDGVSKLSIAEVSLELRERGHEGDFPREESVDRVLAALVGGSGSYALSATVARKYYVETREDGSSLSLGEIAKELDCGERKVREAYKFALGYMSAVIEMGFIV